MFPPTGACSRPRCALRSSPSTRRSSGRPRPSRSRSSSLRSAASNITPHRALYELSRALMGIRSHDSALGQRSALSRDGRYRARSPGCSRWLSRRLECWQSSMPRRSRRWTWVRSTRCASRAPAARRSSSTACLPSVTPTFVGLVDLPARLERESRADPERVRGRRYRIPALSVDRALPVAAAGTELIVMFVMVLLVDASRSSLAGGLPREPRFSRVALPAPSSSHAALSESASRADRRSSCTARAARRLPLQLVPASVQRPAPVRVGRGSPGRADRRGRARGRRPHRHLGRRPRKPLPGRVARSGGGRRSPGPPGARTDRALGRGTGFSLPSFAYGALDDEPGVLARLLAAVSHFGFALLTGAPTDDGTVAEVAERFGVVRTTNYGRVFDVSVRAEATNLADTARGLSLHTDTPTVPRPPRCSFSSASPRA